MKNKLLLVIAMIISISCTKEKFDRPQTQRCGWINYKYFNNPSGDTQLINRRYYGQWAPDTICPITNPLCGIIYTIELTRQQYDTMLVVRYPDRFCID